MTQAAQVHSPEILENNTASLILLSSTPMPEITERLKTSLDKGVAFISSMPQMV